jgi:predicted DsbA family dithiol-disulfide isomerase
MRVDIWSDVICPWCYLGKRRFESALSAFEYAPEVEIRWRSFELDPHAPAVREGDPTARLASKYGLSVEQARAAQDRLTALAAAEGLQYRLDRTRPGNTFDAHRLIHLAGERGIQDHVKERLLAAYLCDGQPIGDPDALVAVAASAGLDAVEVKELLAGRGYADEVRADEMEAREREISGVPFFLIDGAFGIPGAQESDTMLTILRRAWARREAGGGEGLGRDLPGSDER